MLESIESLPFCPAAFSTRKDQMNGYTDIHTHILPGVDDGARDMSQALELVRMAYRNGTRNIILTPHYRGKYKENAPVWLREVFGIFQQMVAEEFPRMNLYMGHEVYYEMDAGVKLEAKKAMTLNGSRYCLLEFRTNSLRSQIEMGVAEMLRFGYVPIIAHAERYDIFRKDSTLTDEMLAMGALIQLNADSVMGKHGLGVTMFCDRLLRDGKAHFIATDAHDSKKRPPLLRDCWWKVYKKYGQSYATQLFYANAQAVIENKTIYG